MKIGCTYSSQREGEITCALFNGKLRPIADENVKAAGSCLLGQIKRNENFFLGFLKEEGREGKSERDKRTGSLS